MGDCALAMYAVTYLDGRGARADDRHTLALCGMWVNQKVRESRAIPSFYPFYPHHTTHTNTHTFQPLFTFKSTSSRHCAVCTVGPAKASAPLMSG